METLTIVVIAAACLVPILVLEWGLAWRVLVLELRPLIAVVIMATLYLGCADIVATRDGIWSTDPARTLFSAGDFVLDDWIFLFVTNLLIAQTVILALDEDIREVVRRFFHRG